MKRSIVMLMIPLLVSGCMMTGAGAVGHRSTRGQRHADRIPTIGQALIKEAVIEGVRVTAEFPPAALGDTPNYRVTLRRVRDSTAIADAVVTMFIALADTRDRGTSITARALGNGLYVLRPVFAGEGTYRYLIRVERVGQVTPIAALELEQVVRIGALIDPGAASGAEDHAGNSRFAPAALLGGAAMAVMMLVMWR